MKIYYLLELTNLYIKGIKMIADEIKEILVDTLGIESNEVKLEANLIDDLAVESIDFVDIIYSLEQKYALKINPGDIFPSFMQEEEIFEENGELKKEFKHKLHTNYPHFNDDTLSRFESSKEANVFFKVSALVDYIELKKAA